MKEDSTFTYLAHGLTEAERVKMLDKLRDITSEEMVVQEVMVPDEKETSASADPVIYSLNYVEKILIFFMALFSSRSYEKTTQDYYLDRLAKKLDRGYGGLFSLKDGILHAEMGKMFKEASGSFGILRPVVKRAFQNKSDFIAFLAAWVLPVIQTRLTAETDPWRVAEEGSLTDYSEIRKVVDGKKEEIFQEITKADRDEIYGMVRALHALNHLLSFPMEKLVNEFTGPGNTPRPCPVREVRELLGDFANRLAGLNVEVPPFLLEVLFLYGKDLHDEGADSAVMEELKVFLKAGQTGLVRIKRLKTQVPFERMLKVINKSIDYILVVSLPGGEEWFALFRRFWEEKIQGRLVSFQRERKRQDLAAQGAAFLGRPQLDLLPNYIGRKVGEGFTLENEISAALLLGFYQDVFLNRINSMLKLIQVDGDFYKDQNRDEFDSAYKGIFSAFDNQRKLSVSLRPEGDLGKKLQLLQRQTGSREKRLTDLKEFYKPVERDVKKNIDSFLNYLDVLCKVVGGILFGEVGGRYDSLSNLSYLGGSNNERIIRSLSDVYSDMKKAMDLFYQLQDLEQA